MNFIWKQLKHEKDFGLKFIHMLRNLIDVIASYKKMPFGNNSVEKDNLDSADQPQAAPWIQLE